MAAAPVKVGVDCSVAGSPVETIVKLTADELAQKALDEAAASAAAALPKPPTFPEKVAQILADAVELSATTRSQLTAALTEAKP